MFSKTSGHTNYDKGNPKPSIIKKKARTTILNVLNKRQTQEKPEKRSSPPEQAWRPEFPTRQPADQGRDRTQSATVSSTYQPPAAKTSPTRSPDHATKNADKPPNRIQRQSSVSKLVKQWSNDNFTQGTQEKRQHAATFSSPGSVNAPKTSLSSSYPPSVIPNDDDENRYSVVIQSCTNYPPPTRRKSSADVTPHDVTVNAIRVYEATTKMVDADPELLARLDKYPSRDPPVVSPTSIERFTWERDANTGIEQKTRAVVLKGKSLTQGSRTIPNNELGTRPRLVADSVQVSIPFGVPESPTSPTRKFDSGSDGWSSSVSVCVPFQVTEDQRVKPLPVKGGMRPQSLPPTDGLAIEALNELFDGSDDSVSSPTPGHVAIASKLTHSSMSSTDSTVEIPSRDDSDITPKLVTVRRRPEDETVQKIVHFDDSLLRSEPPSDVFDSEDGIGMSKHGKYTLVDQNFNTATPEAKKSSSLTRNQQPPQSESAGSPKVRPRAIQVNSKAPYSAAKAKAASLSANKDEVAMLRARIRQLEEELEREKTRHAPNDAILSSIPILEKEKLRLQAQVNEALQDLAKAKAQIRTSTYTTNRLEAEKDVLETRYKKIEKDHEKLKSQNAEFQFERDQLLREKKNWASDAAQDLDANLITIQSLSQRNEELTQSESELKERVCVLVEGLRDVRESVLKVKEENTCLHEEIVDNGVAMAESMKKCLHGLQQVVDRMNNEFNKRASTTSSNASEENDEIQRLTEELKDSKSCMHALLQRVIELETTGGANSEETTPKQANYDGCPGCAKLREELKELQMDYDEMKEKYEKMEAEIEDLNEDREDLQQEAKYLKKVLSYRNDVMQVQVSEKTTRQLQRLETNLEEAEKKCRDLEGEVGNLFKQKQSLLVNIMKLHDEETAEQNGDGADDDDDDDDVPLSDDDDDDYSSDEQTRKTSSSRPKSGSLKRPFYGNISNESEFSSGASFYGSDTESDSESDEWSELENSSRRLRDLVSGLKSERKRMRSNVKELMTDKRSLNKRIDKSTADFKALMKRMENLDSENASLREKVKTERRALKSKLKKEETESKQLRESIKEMEGEKAALMKCIEMNSAVNEAEIKEPEEEIDMDDMAKLIAKAQAFAQEERDSKKQDTIEEESEGEEEGESGDEKDNEDEESEGKEDAESEEKLSSSSEEEEPIIIKKPKHKPDKLLLPVFENYSKSVSEEEQFVKDKEEEDREKYEMEDVISPPPPPPQARLLQRRASTVGINMDRVNREKQHLEEEVASLKKYLNRSAYRRRYSTVESPKAPPLGAMKTLESLLQKSDLELKEASANICRLQSLNADMEERLKDAELNQDDLRRAVVIANSYAAEEREKNTALEEERDSLLQKVETLKRENSRLRKSRAINAAYRKGGRPVKSLTTSEEDLVADSDGADVESDYSSVSRKSSNASDL